MLSKGRTFDLSIIDYLAYGLYKYEKGKGNVYMREHFEPGGKFKLILKYNKSYENEMFNSLYMMFSYGGLGSRTRNGFGCLYSKGLEIPRIKKEEKLKSFTTLSKEAKLFVFKEHDNWCDALSEIGIAYKDARLSLENKHNFYKRSLIAMPIEVKGESIPETIRKGRHAKPYFLHVNKLDNGKFQGQILFMPYKYAPGGKFSDDQLNRYKEAYNKMNDYLGKEAKGVKNEF